MSHLWMTGSMFVCLAAVAVFLDYAEAFRRALEPLFQRPRSDEVKENRTNDIQRKIRMHGSQGA